MLKNRAGTPKSIALPTFTVNTSILYGVFVSEKSYLLGIKNLVKREHANMLVRKATGHLLPQELMNSVADALLELERQTVKEKWDWNLDFSENEKVFEYTPEDPLNTTAERTAFKRVKELNISLVKVRVNRPGALSLDRGEPGSIAKYVHLSTSKARPNIHMNLPHQTPAQRRNTVTPSGAIYYGGDKGGSFASLVPGKWGALDQNFEYVAVDKLEYKPDAHLSQAERDGPEKMTMQASRLIGCSSLEDAVMSWDAEGLRAFVDLLELHVVPFDQSDPLKPGVHILQRIFDD